MGPAHIYPHPSCPGACRPRARVYSQPPAPERRLGRWLVTMAQQHSEPCPASRPLCPVPSPGVLGLGRPGSHCWLGTRSLGYGPSAGWSTRSGAWSRLQAGGLWGSVLLPLGCSAAVPVLWAGEGRLQPPRPWLGPGTWAIVSSLRVSEGAGEGPRGREPLEPWSGIRGLGVRLGPQSTLAWGEGTWAPQFGQVCPSRSPSPSSDQ